MRLSPVRIVLGTLACLLPCSAMAADGTVTADGKSGAQIRSVVELYTSQGCSSCPPADALLQSYIEKDGVLALSFNVDIWDSLGWKDTLASPTFTKRQRAYAQTRGDGQVYTPQAVVNGMMHAVGSDRANIDADIRQTDAKIKSMRVSLAVSHDGDGIEVDVPAWPVAKTAAVDATLWLVRFTPLVEVEIHHGENSGHKIAYHNVVREIVDVGHWRGEHAVIKVARAAVADCRPGTCAILVQQGGTGSIFGAAWVPGLSGI